MVQPPEGHAESNGRDGTGDLGEQESPLGLLEFRAHSPTLLQGIDASIPPYEPGFQVA